ncbi:D-threonine aldolase-like [Glandiceps talaboti]
MAAQDILNPSVLRHPCKIGDKVDDIDTPALVVDLDKMERNMKKMTTLVDGFKGRFKLRPHAKTHKCPEIAKIQIQHGAVGVCVQKGTEAEAMVRGGIKDVLVTNEIYGKTKLSRLVPLAKEAHITMCIDSAENLRQISEVAKKHDVIIDILVEVNVKMHRCGVEPEEVVPLAKLAQELPNVNFAGLQCYNGMNQHIREAPFRMVATKEAMDVAAVAKQNLTDAGIECDYLTGAGTGTFKYETKIGVLNELQCGSYIFMDVDYCRNRGDDGNPFQDFEQSLFVLATVQSLQGGDLARAVVDAGIKAVGMDSGPPSVHQWTDLMYVSVGDEHGLIVPPGPFKLGDKVFLIPGHCDPCVNLYDWIVGIRNDVVETIWPITGRGPGI